MGYYVNPRNMSKEEWLAKHGTPCLRITHDEVPKNKMLVALINNGPFTAAGVAYSAREHEEFTRTDDRRPKSYYLVDKDVLFSDPAITPPIPEKFRETA